MEHRVFLNRYRLSLGRNGLPVELHRTPLGVSYRAQEMESGREVTIELISALPPDPLAQEELGDQACAAGQISHPAIPALYDFGVEDEQIIYVTEYFDGPTAQAWVAARGPLRIGAVLRVALQVVDALGAARFHGLIHQELNPANIVFVPGSTPQGEWPAIKLVHWLGPPVHLVPNDPKNERLDAAACYASPEQLGGGAINFAATIYSLGCVIWFLMTGAPPMKSGERVGLGQKLRGLPKIVRHLLDRMLRFAPAERPHDPVALSAFLQTCLARVERRENIGRRLGVPPVRAPRLAKPRKPIVIPYKTLALAALFLALATATALFLPNLWTSHRVVAAKAEPIQEISRADEIPVVMKDSIGQIPETQQTVIGPPTNNAHSAIALVTHSESIPSSAAPPAEGPSSVPPGKALVSHSFADKAPQSYPVQNAAVAESRDSIAALRAATPTPPESEAVAPTEKPDVAANENASASAEAGSPVEQPWSEDSSHLDSNRPGDETVASTTPKTAARLAESRKVKNPLSSAEKKPSARLRKRNASRLAHARRAKPLPKLRVGSSRAELVGTTSDGHWILSLADSGRRIIVPPPPGFGP